MVIGRLERWQEISKACRKVRWLSAPINALWRAGWTIRETLSRSRYFRNSIRDGVRSYDEVSCAAGALGRIRGKDLLPILLDRADRSKKFGA